MRNHYDLFEADLVRENNLKFVWAYRYWRRRRDALKFAIAKCDARSHWRPLRSYV